MTLDAPSQARKSVYRSVYFRRRLQTPSNSPAPAKAIVTGSGTAVSVTSAWPERAMSYVPAADPW
jgi:hypothetical protein